MVSSSTDGPPAHDSSSFLKNLSPFAGILCSPDGQGLMRVLGNIYARQVMG
jgi:hypothetical protein